MNLWQAFKMAFKSIALKKTRSFLTMLGIIIGVASVVIMVSVMQGQAKKNMEYFTKMGDNKIEVYAYSYYDTENETGQKLFDYCLSLSDLIVGITPDVEISQKGSIQYGSKTIPVNDWEAFETMVSVGGGMMVSSGNAWETMLSFKLGSEQYGVCNNYTLGGGREFTYLEVEKTIPVCVLGSGAKEQLFGFTDPVGETVNINGEPFQVVG